MASKAKGVAAWSKEAPTNPRGIPFAPFVDRVEDYVPTREDVEPTMGKFQEMIAAYYGQEYKADRFYMNSKYQFMETQMQRKAAGLNDKIPDIKKTLDTVRFLKTRKDELDPIETTFELNDTLYAKAEVPPTEEVYIWLGANTMLAYPMDEAETLLDGRLSTAKKSLENCEEDLEFLREQITTMEVAIARVYNWEVVQKRKDKGEEDAKGKENVKSGG